MYPKKDGSKKKINSVIIEEEMAMVRTRYLVLVGAKR